MKDSLLVFGFLLLAGSAAAQQKPAKSSATPAPKRPIVFDRIYPARDGQLRLTDLAPVQPVPGSYRTEPYALRVVVPAPHPDSAAVVPMGQKQPELMPQQPLPPVKLVPEGSGRKVQ